MAKSSDGSVSAITTLPRQTLTDNVYEKIRQAIVNGELEPGSELSQVDFAQRFGVSRVPVREALRQLQAEQLLTASAFKRYVVTGLTPDEIIELTEVRECLEVFALGRTMAAIADGLVDPARFEQLARQLKVDADVETWLQGDIDFHRALSVGAPQAARMAEDTRVRVHRYLRVAVTGESLADGGHRRAPGDPRRGRAGRHRRGRGRPARAHRRDAGSAGGAPPAPERRSGRIGLTRTAERRLAEP